MLDRIYRSHPMPSSPTDRRTSEIIYKRLILSSLLRNMQFLMNRCFSIMQTSSGPDWIAFSYTDCTSQRICRLLFCFPRSSITFMYGLAFLLFFLFLFYIFCLDVCCSLVICRSCRLQPSVTCPDVYLASALDYYFPTKIAF